MYLKQLEKKDLIFSDEIDETCTNTYLNLNDYDWMDYNLTTRFRTKDMGVLNVNFHYFGMVISTMEVEQILDGKTEKATYEYPSEIFKKRIICFMEKHIASWDDKWAFDGEDNVIDFFNDVLKNGKQKIRQTASDHKGLHLVKREEIQNDHVGNVTEMVSQKPKFPNADISEKRGEIFSLYPKN